LKASEKLMSKTNKRAIWLIMMTVVAIAIYWITGCGGGGGYVPQPSPTFRSGTIIIRVGLPQPAPRSISPDEAETESARIIPWNTKSIKVTLTGEGITGQRVETQNLSVSDTIKINLVPTGLKHLYIELKNGQNGGGDTVAVVRHSLFMSSGSTTPINRTMGIGLVSNTEVVPAEIQVNLGSTLLFQKWFDTGGDYQVHLLGPVEKVSPGIRDRTGGSAPTEPYEYYTASLVFDVLGVYTYLSPNHAGAKILVYDPDDLMIASVKGMNSTYTAVVQDLTNEASTVYIKVEGMGFGDRLSNGGSIRLVNVETEEEHNQSNFVYTGGSQKWELSEIQVRVNNLPGGKYRVVVRTDDGDTVYDGHFIKGSGTLDVIIN
jgi:hypothetical protein